ncbi:MAG: hypothetical protein MUC75_03140 [Ignavibacteriaceae bacterium]|nr:hypothetical protein [Ignavibacteriaceae bacterium]
MLFFAFDRASAQDNFKVFVPEFIPSNGIFEVSIITSKKFPEADKLDIYFLPDFSLNINKVEVWVHDVKLQIPGKTEFITEYSEHFQRFTVDFSDTSLITDEAYFQIVITLKSTSTNSDNLKFYGEFIGQEGILGYLENSENKIGSDNRNQFNLLFNYYKKYLTAENAAALNENSYLNIPLIYKFDEVLAVEFWMKINNYNSTFLKIINWETNWAEYYLSVNENQMLVINSKDNDLFRIKPFFISQNIWYHFHLIFDKRNNELSFLCDGEELVKFKITNYLEFDNLVLHFQNDLRFAFSK